MRIALVSMLSSWWQEFLVEQQIGQPLASKRRADGSDLCSIATGVEFKLMHLNRAGIDGGSGPDPSGSDCVCLGAPLSEYEFGPPTSAISEIVV